MTTTSVFGVLRGLGAYNVFWKSIGIAEKLEKLRIARNQPANGAAKA